MSFLAPLRLRRTQLWLVLLAALAVALAYTPLFNLLAYEFCLAMALAGSLAAAHLGSALVAVTRERDEGFLHALRSPPSALLVLIGRAALLGLLLLVLPLCIISLNVLRVRNCDYLEGLAFFAMMPCLSLPVAASVGVLWAIAVPRRWLASLLAVLTVLASLAWGIYRFYAEPPIFGYDPFAGFFPGTLYDEDIAIRPAFLVFRLYNLVWLSAALALAALRFDTATLRLRWGARFPSRRLRTAAMILVAAGLALFGFRAQLGFARNVRSIRAALGGARHTAHFDIYFPSETDAATVELLAQDHEFRYAQLASTLGVSPGRISSYLFRSVEEKRALMGASRTFIAKPWRREVYLQLERFPQRVLKHELAHVFAGTFGDRFFGVSLRWRWGKLPLPVFNVGLIEGVAVAADWRASGEITVHEIAAALRRTGLAPPLRALFGAGFLTEAAGPAYNLAGSFCRYLLERYGAARLRRAYRSGGDFPAAYDGRDLGALLQEWQRFLDDLPVDEEQLENTREVFRQPSLLKRTCGHEVANLQAEAGKLAGAGKFEEAAAILERVVAYQPDEPRHLIELIQTRAASGALRLARSSIPRLLAHPALTVALRRRALELQGDLAWRSGDLEGASRSYAAAVGGPPSERRPLELKRWGLEQPTDIQQLVRDYILPGLGKRPPDAEAAVAVHLAHSLAERLPRSGLGPYLVGKQLWARAAYAEAVAPLRAALARPLPGPAFRREAGLGLAQCLYASGAAAEAIAPLSALLADGSTLPGVGLEVEDWLERVRWRTTGRLR